METQLSLLSLPTPYSQNKRRRRTKDRRRTEERRDQMATSSSSSTEALDEMGREVRDGWNDNPVYSSTSDLRRPPVRAKNKYSKSVRNLDMTPLDDILAAMTGEQPIRSRSSANLVAMTTFQPIRSRSSASLHLGPLQSINEVDPRDTYRAPEQGNGGDNSEGVRWDERPVTDDQLKPPRAEKARQIISSNLINPQPLKLTRDSTRDSARVKTYSPTNHQRVKSIPTTPPKNGHSLIAVFASDGLSTGRNFSQYFSGQGVAHPMRTSSLQTMHQVGTTDQSLPISSCQEGRHVNSLSFQDKKASSNISLVRQNSSNSSTTSGHSHPPISPRFSSRSPSILGHDPSRSAFSVVNVKSNNAPILGSIGPNKNATTNGRLDTHIRKFTNGLNDSRDKSSNNQSFDDIFPINRTLSNEVFYAKDKEINDNVNESDSLNNSLSSSGRSRKEFNIFDNNKYLRPSLINDSINGNANNVSPVYKKYSMKENKSLNNSLVSIIESHESNYKTNNISPRINSNLFKSSTESIKMDGVKTLIDRNNDKLSNQSINEMTRLANTSKHLYGNNQGSFDRVSVPMVQNNSSTLEQLLFFQNSHASRKLTVKSPNSLNQQQIIVDQKPNNRSFENHYLTKDNNNSSNLSLTQKSTAAIYDNVILRKAGDGSSANKLTTARYDNIIPNRDAELRRYSLVPVSYTSLDNKTGSSDIYNGFDESNRRYSMMNSKTGSYQGNNFHNHFQPSLESNETSKQHGNVHTPQDSNRSLKSLNSPKEESYNPRVQQKSSRSEGNRENIKPVKINNFQVSNGNAQAKNGFNKCDKVELKINGIRNEVLEQQFTKICFMSHNELLEKCYEQCLEIGRLHSKIDEKECEIRKLQKQISLHPPAGQIPSR